MRSDPDDRTVCISNPRSVTEDHYSRPTRSSRSREAVRTRNGRPDCVEVWLAPGRPSERGRAEHSLAVAASGAGEGCAGSCTNVTHSGVQLR
jgi:hypothetical protein